MEVVFKYIYTVSVSFWVGGISLFSFVQAPSLFRKLERDKAGICVEAMFPGYYIMGYVCGLLSIISFIYLEGFEFLRLSILIFMFAISLVGGFYLLPMIHSIKEKLKEAYNTGLEKRFHLLHRVSMMLNFIIWLCGMFILYFVSRG